MGFKKFKEKPARPPRHHIRPQPVLLPALPREGTVLTAGRTKGETRKPSGRDESVERPGFPPSVGKRTPQDFPGCYIYH